MNPLGPGLVHELRLELLIELGLAVLLGGVLGLERELKDKPAGLRTHILICAGATLFTDISHRLGLEGGDPGRIAAQILTGIGFIGAGTILHMGVTVRGLTTAANIWVVAAIGMALGFGAYLDAMAATALVLVVLVVLGRVEDRLSQKSSHGRLVIRLGPEAPPVEELTQLAREAGLEIESMEARKEPPGTVVELEVRGSSRAHEQAVSALLRHQGVRAASLQA